MATATPRRSLRIPLIQTPKMPERKKGLFQGDGGSVKESLTKHRRLPALDSDTDSEDCDLGIISVLDRSSSDEMNDEDLQKTQEKSVWHATRSHTSKILKENQNLKHFIKSPFTLKKYKTLYEPKSSQSTPVTPYMESHPDTPSSTKSCNSYTSSSEHGHHSRARKNLASFIAYTESCSSSVIEIAESPEDCCDSETSHKRLRNDSMTSDSAPSSKYLKLDPATAPKARLSLFNSDRFKEILSVKSFYGKCNIQRPTHDVVKKFERAVLTTVTHPRRPIFQTRHSRSRRKNRRPGQINMGVYHKIRKPKVHSKRQVKISAGPLKSSAMLDNSSMSNQSLNKSAITVKNSLQSDVDFDKTDPFASEKQTIAAILSQWTEEDLPERELAHINKVKSQELTCFNAALMEESNPILPPVSAVPVDCDNMEMGEGSVLFELGVNQSEVTKPTEVMPMESSYLVMEEVQEDVPDLDEIERELQSLDEKILKLAKNNNMDKNNNGEAVLAYTECVLQSSEDKNKAESEETSKLFPIFSTPDTGLEKANGKVIAEKAKKPIIKSITNQYVIDAGQKRFGATQCGECGVIYEIGDPQDEYDHLIHHNATNILKFPGWKEERVVGRWEQARCICIRGSDNGWKRVQALLSRLVHPQLGYDEQLPLPSYIYTAYLYIEKKEIIGCLIVEPKAKANKFLPGDPDCCTFEEYPVKCGISRIWTHANSRRRGIAVKMLECARASFLHGCAIKREDVAFSAPTASGKALATAYTATQQFYTYMY